MSTKKIWRKIQDTKTRFGLWMHASYKLDAQWASYQVLVHLAKRFQTRRFCLEIDQPETRIAYGGQVYQIGTKRVIFI